ncbi:MAG: 2-amino-4-hydroxy-6-hydroxymethyldihydropteridine diphosphokinase [Clostridiales bacterium]|nr:MAG: 2-amino-4-hydroxy-6-hydroxymethyldihydropteridine diphosphokinase [Clostridiales bacterium]
MKKIAFIAVGGNVGNTITYIETALDMMPDYGIEVLKKSKLIKTKPYGNVEQDDFINGAILVSTEKTSIELLDALLDIEKKLGRVRIIKWGPRTIDLDLLFYDNEILNTERLTLPHPEIQKRMFVLEPLCDIEEDFIHPILNKTMKELKIELELNNYLEWLEKREKFGIKLGLENTKLLLNEFDNPHKKIKCLHVAGTNGKGSVCTYLSSVLKTSGYKVGLFTSPFIETFRERFQINGENITSLDLLNLLKKIKSVVLDLETKNIHPTYFEILTVMCFDYFYMQNVDFAVIEVGLGGLYDSTNVITNPIASFITAIDFDHTDFLGDTLEKIAEQKAGIIKENCPVYCYLNTDEVVSVLKNTAVNKNSEFNLLSDEVINIKSLKLDDMRFDYGNFKDIELSMWGKHQVYNASLAIMGLLSLRDKGVINFTDEALYKGLNSAKIIARLERLSKKPTFIIDGAHNMQGVRALVDAIKEISYNKLILGVGILKDKDYKGIIELICPLADEIIATELDMPRALNSKELAREITKLNKNVVAISDLHKAVDKTFDLATEDDVIIWGGSLYLTGEVRKYVKSL